MQAPGSTLNAKYYLNISPNILRLVLFHNLFNAYKENEVKIVLLYLSHFLGGEGVFSAT
jgi:hypothetical protein